MLALPVSALPVSGTMGIISAVRIAGQHPFVFDRKDTTIAAPTQKMQKEYTNMSDLCSLSVALCHLPVILFRSAAQWRISGSIGRKGENCAFVRNRFFASLRMTESDDIYGACPANYITESCHTSIASEESIYRCVVLGITARSVCANAYRRTMRYRSSKRTGNIKK